MTPETEPTTETEAAPPTKRCNVLPNVPQQTGPWPLPTRPPATLGPDVFAQTIPAPPPVMVPTGDPAKVGALLAAATVPTGPRDLHGLHQLDVDLDAAVEHVAVCTTRTRTRASSRW